MSERVNEAREARYFRENYGRIRDREWCQPGYVLKVWAVREDGGGLTDVGPEVEAELSGLLALLNGHAAALAAARAEGAAEAFERAMGMASNTYEAADKLLAEAQECVSRLRAANDDSDYGLLKSAHEHIMAARGDLDADLK